MGDDKMVSAEAERDRLAIQLSDIWLHCTGVVCTAEEGPEGDNIPALVKEMRELCEEAQEQRDFLEMERDAAWDLFDDAAYVDGERKPLVECVESLIEVASKLSGLIDERNRLARKVERMSEALTCWGAYAHAPFGRDSDALDAALEATPPEFFPSVPGAADSYKDSPSNT